MASSTIVAAKTNLLAQLQARAALSTVQVVWGQPSAPSRELIMLADVKGEQEPGALGQQRREERYTLQVWARVQSQSTDQQIASTRAMTLAGEIENQIREDWTINGAVREAQIAGPYELHEFASADGSMRSAVVLVSVACRARI